LGKRRNNREACADPEGFAKGYVQTGMVFRKWRGPQIIPIVWGRGETTWKLEWAP